MRDSRILIVEGDPRVRDWLSRGLDHAGFEVRAVGSAVAALAQLGGDPPDALVVDAHLPDGAGHELRRALRTQGMDAPALMLVPPDGLTEPMVVVGTGDDYVTTPFNLDEVVARVRALVRDSRRATAITVGSVRLDAIMHAMSGENGAAALTPTEFRMFAALAEHHGAIVRREELVVAAWPPGAVVHDNTLDQYIARLRRKLRNVTRGTVIVTTRGVGYRLE